LNVPKRFNSARKSNKIDIHFERTEILSVEIGNPGQLQLINGAKNSFSFANFMIRDLLPGEYQGAKITAKSNIPLEANLWSQDSGESPEVFI
jgi:hypothetical protein